MVNSKLGEKTFHSMRSELWKMVIQGMTMKAKMILQIQMMMKTWSSSSLETKMIIYSQCGISNKLVDFIEDLHEGDGADEDPLTFDFNLKDLY